MALKKGEMTKAATEHSSTFEEIASGNYTEIEPESKQEPEPPRTQKTRGTKQAAPGYYRFSLSMPNEYEGYLKQAAYDASAPGHIVSINAYICELIRQDMEAKKRKDQKEG